jgi:hypothetical protein
MLNEPPSTLHAPSMVVNTSRRKRRHLSFPGVVVPILLAAMAILSLVGVMLGTRLAAQSSKGAVYLPAYFLSNQVSSSSNDIEAAHDIRDDFGEGSDSNDKQTGGRIDEADASLTNPRSNYEHITFTSHSLNFPRIIFLNGESGGFVGFLRRKSDDQKRVIKMSKKEIDAQKRLVDSDDFSYRDPLYEGEFIME